jgi:hypothetical protein
MQCSERLRFAGRGSERHQPDLAVGAQRAGMKRHAAEFERLRAVRPQRLKQLLHVSEQRIEPAEFVAARYDRLHRLVHDRISHAAMRDKHVEHRDLR